MEAELFYSVDEGKAVLLQCVSLAEWEQGIQLTDRERNYCNSRQFKGRLGDWFCVYDPDGMLEKAYIGSGIGRQDLALAQAALQLPVGTYQLQGSLSQTAVVNWGLAQYRFCDYKKWDGIIRRLIIEKANKEAVLSLVDAVFLTRDLINKPANAMAPQDLADCLSQLAKDYDADFEQWVGSELLEANFPAIHTVGRASDCAPRLLSLTWGDPKNPRIALVGKGVCFDSGGLDIKPSANMRFMKKDMGGAAQVIGLAQWVMQRQLPICLHVLIPAVENAIGPNAFKPGDVLTMRNGLTVEIDNTDAEGRLILADALVKACEEKPELIIDFSTLTGAARVAVGTEISAMFCNNEALASGIASAAERVVDPVWRLPLFAGYEELLNSSVADLVNSSPSPYAGAITAGLFLQRFITQGIPWVHFDIMAWNLSNKPGKPEGGEAMGLRAIAEYFLGTYR
jgi:leucyl aminopeptidase